MSDKLLWTVRRMLRILGWPAIAGVAVMTATLVLYFETLQPLQLNLAEFRQETNSLRSKVAARRGSRATQGPTEQLTAFYDFFPQGDGLTEALGKLYDAAAKQNIVLDQGEYHLAAEHEGKLARYDIVLPIKGQYPKLRAFIAQALKDNTSLALEGVTFNRQGAIDVGVDAQVRLTLYLRAASS